MFSPRVYLRSFSAYSLALYYISDKISSGVNQKFIKTFCKQSENMPCLVHKHQKKQLTYLIIVQDIQKNPCTYVETTKNKKYCHFD